MQRDKTRARVKRGGRGIGAPSRGRGFVGGGGRRGRGGRNLIHTTAGRGRGRRGGLRGRRG